MPLKRALNTWNRAWDNIYGGFENGKSATSLSGGGLKVPDTIVYDAAKGLIKSGTRDAVMQGYGEKTVIATGKVNSNGRRIIRYSDGSVEYAE